MDQVLGFGEEIGVPINATITISSVTGWGKSTFRYAYALYGKRSGVFDDAWINSTEINDMGLSQKTKAVPNKPWERGVDLLFTGSGNGIDKLVKRATESPNSKRIVILDSPDS